MSADIIIGGLLVALGIILARWWLDSDRCV